MGVSEWLAHPIVEEREMSRRSVYETLCKLTVDGWPASVREVSNAAGYASPSTVQVHLEQLERDGFAERHPRREKGGWRPGIRRGEP